MRKHIRYHYKERLKEHIQQKPCQMKRVCEILGQCAYDHPLITNNPAAVNELRKRHDSLCVAQLLKQLSK